MFSVPGRSSFGSPSVPTVDVYTTRVTPASAHAVSIERVPSTFVVNRAVGSCAQSR